ncbi:MAG: glycosyltransferase family 2 protein [Paludibacter sp.]|nr:glycosyltransferase family 2 protein [Paludibacter sp.]
MKISIITATYNSERFLQRTIDSVAAQDHADIEYIIIDGGSTDNTLNIIRSNANCITKFISEKDSGIYSALNKGIKLATGEIIGFLNSDDVYSNNHSISKIATCFEIKQCDVLYGDLVYQTKHNLNPKTVRYWKSNSFHSGCLKYGWMPPHPTLYCKKAIYDQYGLYNEQFKISADYDYILRIFKQPEIYKMYYPTVIVKMNIGGISNGSVNGIIKKTKEDLQALRLNKVGGYYTIAFKYLRKIRQLIKIRNSKFP